MANKSKNSLINIIVSIASILFIVAIVGFVFKFTNGLNEDFKSFYLEHNGKQIVAADSQMTFDTGSEHLFECKYISTPEDSSYSVKVVPNDPDDTDFSFTVDGKFCIWSGVKDLTSCFNLDKQANYFTISFPADFSMQGVLNSLYPESVVVISDDISDYLCYFTLQVSNYNGSVTYNIDFNVYDVQSYINIINENAARIRELELENAELNELKSEVEKYLPYLDNFESLDTVIVTLLLDDYSIYSVMILPKGTMLYDIVLPDTLYCSFEGWLLNGESVSLHNYTVLENTRFVAEYIPICDISFIVDGELFKYYLGLEGHEVNFPVAPLKDGYHLNGWLDSNGNLVDENSYIATESMTFTANYELLEYEFNVLLDMNSSFSGCVSENYGDLSLSTFVLSKENPVVEIEFSLNQEEHSYKYYRTVCDLGPFSVSIDLDETKLSGKITIMMEETLFTLDSGEVIEYYSSSGSKSLVIELSCPHEDISSSIDDELWELE